MSYTGVSLSLRLNKTTVPQIATKQTINLLRAFLKVYLKEQLRLTQTT